MTRADERGLREILASHYPDVLGQIVLSHALLAWAARHGESVRGDLCARLVLIGGNMEHAAKLLSAPIPEPRR